MEKSERQQLGATKWRDNKGIGGFIYPTGFGKTYMTINFIIKPMLAKNPNLTAKILVPTTDLKNQWNNELQKFIGTNDKIQVDTVQNTVMKHDFFSVDLLVLDEMDEYYSNNRKEIWTRQSCYFRYLVWLSAFPNDKQGRDKNFLSLFPVIDMITEKEALDKGWISPYITFNLEVELNEDERILYTVLSEEITANLSKFNNNFKLAMACLAGFKEPNGNRISPYQIAEAHAYKMGWLPNYNDLTYLLQQSSEDRKRYDDINNLWNPNKVMGYAKNLNKAIHGRKSLLASCQAKYEAVVHIIGKFNTKRILTFTNSTDLANRIAVTLNNDAGKIVALSYHSKLNGQIMFRRNGVPDILADETNGELITTKAGKVKLYGNTSLRKMILEAHRLNRFPILCTADALNKGYDDPTINFSITTAIDTVNNTYIQRAGRLKRLLVGKKAITVNIYCKDTVDYFNLKQAQNKSDKTYIHWIKDWQRIEEEYVENPEDYQIFGI